MARLFIFMAFTMAFVAVTLATIVHKDQSISAVSESESNPLADVTRTYYDGGKYDCYKKCFKVKEFKQVKETEKKFKFVKEKYFCGYEEEEKDQKKDMDYYAPEKGKADYNDDSYKPDDKKDDSYDSYGKKKDSYKPDDKKDDPYEEDENDGSYDPYDKKDGSYDPYSMKDESYKPDDKDDSYEDDKKDDSYEPSDKKDDSYEPSDKKDDSYESSDKNDDSYEDDDKDDSYDDHEGEYAAQTGYDTYKKPKYCFRYKKVAYIVPKYVKKPFYAVKCTKYCPKKNDFGYKKY